MSIHKRTYGHEVLWLDVDLADAASPIMFAWAEKGDPRPTEFFSSPYQTADARHDLSRAFRLVTEWGSSDE